MAEETMFSIPCDACGTEGAETMEQKIGRLCEQCYNAWNCPCSDCKSQAGHAAVTKIAEMVVAHGG